MSGSPQDRKAQNYAECAALARAGDYDRWLATLLMPADKRPHAQALIAFNVEVSRIREVVAEPRLGEIRLAWWRETLSGAREEAAGHPVAASLLETVSDFRLPLEPFLSMIDARVFDLWNDPAPDLAWLEGYCAETSSSLFRLTSLILADGADPGGAEEAGHAGLAWAFAGLMRALPWHAANGQVYVPGDLLARHGASTSAALGGRAEPGLLAALADWREEARAHLRRAQPRDPPAALRLAFAPIALVEPYLRRMERPAYDPFVTPIDLPAWRKIAAIWRRAR